MDYAPLLQPSQVVSPEAARRLVEAFLYNGWNSHDPERVLACVTEDVVWWDPFIPGGVAHGHGAARGWLRSMWDAAPDTTFELIDDVYLSLDRTKIAAPWRIIGTGIAGVDLYEFRGTLISHVRTMVAVSLTQAQQVAG